MLKAHGLRRPKRQERLQFGTGDGNEVRREYSKSPAREVAPRISPQGIPAVSILRPADPQRGTADPVGSESANIEPRNVLFQAQQVHVIPKEVAATLPHPLNKDRTMLTRRDRPLATEVLSEADSRLARASDVPSIVFEPEDIHVQRLQVHRRNIR